MDESKEWVDNVFVVATRNCRVDPGKAQVH